MFPNYKWDRKEALCSPFKILLPIQVLWQKLDKSFTKGKACNSCMETIIAPCHKNFVNTCQELPFAVIQWNLDIFELEFSSVQQQSLSLNVLIFTLDTLRTGVQYIRT